MPQDLSARVRPLYSPLLRIVPTQTQVTLEEEEAAIFTSSNGVMHGPAGQGRIAYCVGAATTQVAREKGWTAEKVGADATSLVAALANRPVGAPLVHIRGQHTRGDVAGHLADAGHLVRDVIVYDQVVQPLSSDALNALTGDGAVVVPLFSPRTAKQFANCAPRATSLQVIALSPAVADAAQPFETSVVATRPDAEAMYIAIDQAVGSG